MVLSSPVTKIMIKCALKEYICKGKFKYVS